MMPARSARLALTVLTAALLLGQPQSTLAQSPGGPAPTPRVPAADGLRFPREGEKTLETLAPKAGGPTERIEIQSTDDHRDYVVKTYVLKKANSAEVYELIQQAVELEGGFVSRVAPGSCVAVDPVNFTAEPSYEGESLLVVTAPEWMIPHLDQTIAILDKEGLQAGAFGTGALYAHVEHRLPSEVAELIKETSASPFIVLKPDDTRQLLYVEDTPSYFAADLEALRTFDVPPPQIETRVRIYEIKESNGRDVGLDWNAWKKSIRDGNLTAAWANRQPNSYNLDLQSLSAELSFTPEIATEFLNYMVSKGHAQVVTDSRLTQTNSQAAAIRSVLQVPYIVRGMIDGAVADAPHRDSPQATDADGLIKEFTEGVVVEMTPRIGTEIELNVTASVSSHVGYTPGQSVPLITESEVETVALLLPGKPAVLGGLSRETLVNERTGIVGLASIPYVNYLFSREVQRKQKSHIIVTIELDKVLAGAPQSTEAAALPPTGELVEASAH